MSKYQDHRYTTHQIPRPSRFSRFLQQDTYQGAYPSDHAFVGMYHDGLGYGSWNVLGMCYYNEQYKYYNNPQNVIETFDTYKIRVAKIINHIIAKKQQGSLYIIALQEATFLAVNAPDNITQTSWNHFRQACISKLQDAGLQVILSEKLAGTGENGRECAILYDNSHMYCSSHKSLNNSVKADFHLSTIHEKQSICFASLHARYKESGISDPSIECNEILKDSTSSIKMLAGDFNTPLHSFSTNNQITHTQLSTNISAPTGWLNNYNMHDDRNGEDKSYDGFFIKDKRYDSHINYYISESFFFYHHPLTTHKKICFASFASLVLSSISRFALQFFLSETAIPLLTKNTTNCIILASSIVFGYVFYDGSQKDREVCLYTYNL
jgi:hypothetical protein